MMFESRYGRLENQTTQRFQAKVLPNPKNGVFVPEVAFVSEVTKAEGMYEGEVFPKQS